MKKIAILGLSLLPSAAFAQEKVGVQNINDLIELFNSTLNTITAILISLAVVYFIIGVFKYVRSGGDPEGKSDGVKKMISGIVGIFIMVSVWGLVNILRGTFGFNDDAATQQEIREQIPEVPTIR